MAKSLYRSVLIKAKNKTCFYWLRKSRLKKMATLAFTTRFVSFLIFICIHYKSCYHLQHTLQNFRTILIPYISRSINDQLLL